ncbi:MAG: hypothetical protein ABSG84_01630 [Acidobacteriaceae bacterium]
MESRSNRHSIREFIDSLVPGSRVIWIANGALGTIQPDRTILWDDGHHMTHKQMNDSHALLIRSEAERTLLQETLARRLNCFKCGCTLVSWDAADCKENLHERLCPLALISEPESPSVIVRGKRRLKSSRAAQAS